MLNIKNMTLINVGSIVDLPKPPGGVAPAAIAPLPGNILPVDPIN